MANTKNQTESTTDQKIDSLKPGATIELSRNDEGTRVFAERSGDGKVLRIVREFSDGGRILGYTIVFDEIW